MKAETFQNLEKRYSKLKYSAKQNPQHWKHLSKMEEHTLTMLVQKCRVINVNHRLEAEGCMKFEKNHGP